MAHFVHIYYVHVHACVLVCTNPKQIFLKHLTSYYNNVASLTELFRLRSNARLVVRLSAVLSQFQVESGSHVHMLHG